MEHILICAVEGFAFVVDARVRVDDLIGKLRADFVLGERCAKSQIVAARPPAKVYFQPLVVSPAAAHLLSTICSPVLMARASPRLVASSNPCHSKPLLTLSDLMEPSDQCVVGVHPYRQLDVHPVPEFVEVPYLFRSRPLIRHNHCSLSWPLIAEPVTQIG